MEMKPCNRCGRKQTQDMARHGCWWCANEHAKICIQCGNSMPKWKQRFCGGTCNRAYNAVHHDVKL